MSALLQREAGTIFNNKGVMVDMAVEQGIVKWFSAPKGFGFLQRETGEDLFVHFKNIIGEGYKSLNEGDRVQFTVEAGPKGLMATNVSKI